MNNLGSSPNSGLEIAIADGPNIPQEKHPSNRSYFLRGMGGYLVLAAYTMATACGGRAPPTSTQSPNLQATVQALQNENRSLRRNPVPTLESRVRNTPTPTLENRRVYGIDVHHGKFQDEQDTLKRITNYVNGKGWKIEKINAEPLTSKYLQQKGISILHIQNVTLPYTENEIAEIKKFVEQGGGIFLVANNPSLCEEYSKEVAIVFGVRITDYFIGSVGQKLAVLEVTTSSNHPLMKDVNSIYLSEDSYGYCGNNWGSPPYLKVSSPAFSVLEGDKTEPYKPLIAAAEVGKGRVVIAPSIFSFRMFTYADNSTFFRNSLYWLQQEKLP